MIYKSFGKQRRTSTADIGVATHGQIKDVVEFFENLSCCLQFWGIGHETNRCKQEEFTPGCWDATVPYVMFASPQ